MEGRYSITVQLRTAGLHDHRERGTNLGINNTRRTEPRPLDTPHRRTGFGRTEARAHLPPRGSNEQEQREVIVLAGRRAKRPGGWGRGDEGLGRRGKRGAGMDGEEALLNLRGRAQGGRGSHGEREEEEVERRRRPGRCFPRVSTYYEPAFGTVHTVKRVI